MVEAEMNEAEVRERIGELEKKLDIEGWSRGDRNEMDRLQVRLFEIALSRN